ncbi:MAG: flotillin family protein [Crocosphaera sp.]
MKPTETPEIPTITISDDTPSSHTSNTNSLTTEIPTIVIADQTSSSQTPASNSFFSLILFPIILTILGSVLSVWFLKSFLCICKPNEVVILSGRQHQTKKGKKIGYRVLTGGRAIRIPILETVKRINVTTTPIRLEIRKAYSKGGTPVNIQAIANVKVSSNPNLVGNAIERFLERDYKEIIRVSQETLEGNLRAVIATLTPQQINEDRLRFAQRVTSDISKDFEKLGLEIDTLKIQNVSDDVKYLDSLSREQIALIIRDAEIAESDAISEAEQIEAECEEVAKVAETQDNIVILEQENNLRTIKAKLEQTAKTEEEITIAIAKEKRAKLEQKLQEVRAKLERLRLQADEILPAQAQRQAMELKAKGEAAIYEENTKAVALVNDLLTKVWQDMGDEAVDLFLIEELETILQQATKIPARLHLNNISIIDDNRGESMRNLLQIYLGTVEQFLNSAGKSMGVDVVNILQEK